jgi:hypothetical protein
MHLGGDLSCLPEGFGRSVSAARLNSSDVAWARCVVPRFCRVYCAVLIFRPLALLGLVTPASPASFRALLAGALLLDEGTDEGGDRGVPPGSRSVAPGRLMVLPTIGAE